MTDQLSVIVIQLDSLNRHFLPCYGNDWIAAPNLMAFARQAAIFDNHFTGSLPCMPARREIWAGTEEFWWRRWGPLEPWDLPLAYVARRHDIPSQLITDHYHLFEWGSHSYQYDFLGYEFIRGHEVDNWRTDPISAVPDWATTMVARRNAWSAATYLRNTQDFRGEADFFGPRVMQAASDWLDRNHQERQFYLHIDSFDVHEPFHIPEPYRSRYTDADYRRYNPWPIYGRIDEGPSALAPDEVEWVRAQFAGKLTMVDTWLGRVLERLDRYRLLERTCVIITTDHGHYLGDHGWMGKPRAPLYHTLCHIPLFVWHPDGVHNGGRVGALTQTVDLYATVLELLGAAVPATANIHSRSLLPLVLGQTETHRDYAVYGYSNERVGITAGEWTLLRQHDPAAGPAHQYTQQVEQLRGSGWWYYRNRESFDYSQLEAGRFIAGVAMPVWRAPALPDLPYTQPDLLFHNPTDPAQEQNLVDEHPEAVQQLETILRAHARALQAPDEQLRRLQLA